MSTTTRQSKGRKTVGTGTQIPTVGICLVLAGFLLVLRTLHVFQLRSTKETSIGGVLDHKVGVGQAVLIKRALIAFSPALAAPDFNRRDPKKEKVHSYVEIVEEKTGRRMLMLYWRTTFLEGTEVDDLFRTEVRGTIKRTPVVTQASIRTSFPNLDPKSTEIYLDEMYFEPIGLNHVLGGVSSVILLLVGGHLCYSSRRSQAAPTGAAVTVAGASRGRPQIAGDGVVSAPSAGRRTCAGCGAVTPAATRVCTVCRAPVEVEYLVAAAVPFEGFERFVPMVAKVLGVSEYQAREPLARVHTPIPYQHLDSFYLKGPGEGAPFRIVGRGLNSLVIAQALASDLKDAGAKALVVGSDELAQVVPARPSSELRYDEDTVTFVFDHGAERDERTIRWSRICLIVFSADVQLRGTMTLARDVRETAHSKDGAAYLLDIYELDHPEAIRIAEDTFYRWEFLKLSGSERPADRFGKLIELLETHATVADLQFVTGAYRGPAQPWRVNYYSRMTYIIGAKSGWAREEGIPKLDGYELLEKVGQGAMGAVYRAKQRRLGRMAAIKVVAPGLAAQEKFIDRFMAEARAVAALSHPNIVQVIDLVEQRGRYFMIMEFVDGTTLGARIKTEKRLPEADALRIGLDVARALEHASQRGIIHRDIKPENIFLTSIGGVKVGDWGLAKEMDQDLGLTDTGTALGTPYYMSPEQASAQRNLDVRSDLYSLGATVYHALAGRPPFRGGSPTEVLIKHLKTPAPDIRELVPTTHATTAALIHRLLAKEREQRCADVSEIVVAFEQALAAVTRV